MATFTGSCEHCGTEFTRERSRGPAPRFCNDTCRVRASEARRGYKYKPAPKAPRSSFRFADCSVCDKLFVQRNKTRSYCYENACELRHHVDRQNRFYHDYKARTGRRPALAARYAESARSRSISPDIRIDIFDPYEVFEGDDWICQICQEEVDPNISAPRPDSVTLDHIVPMERGGEHVRENVQTAHFSCNVAKGNRERLTTTSR